MNQEDILKMASDSGFGAYAYEAASMFERFAALVAAKAAQDEREQCAALCEQESKEWEGYSDRASGGLGEAADKIRARGK